MEPERDIEKDLKAYAQQRRAAGGSPPPLHPANRKALQAEAARLGKSPGGQSASWWQMLFGSWPRLAVAGVAVAAVVIATLQLLPKAADQPEKIPSLAAARRSMPEPAAKPGAPPAAVPPAGQSMTLAENSSAKDTSRSVALESAPVSPPPPAPATPAPSVGTLALNTPAVREDSPVTSSGELSQKLYNPAPASALQPTTATAAPAPTEQQLALKAPRDRSSSVASDKLDTTVESPASAQAAKGGASFGIAGSFNRIVTTDAPATLVTQKFRRTDLPAKSAKLVNASNLLATFKVEQDLGRLRVIDTDGSVYLGFIEQTPEGAKEAEAILDQELRKKEVTKTKSTAPMQAFRFRVTGTNRTLKEEVVFTGNFLTKAGSQSTRTTNAVGFSGAATVAPGSRAEPVLFDLQKARMEGRLLLGGTNNFEIKAAPVKR